MGKPTESQEPVPSPWAFASKQKDCSPPSGGLGTLDMEPSCPCLHQEDREGQGLENHHFRVRREPATVVPPPGLSGNNY